MSGIQEGRDRSFKAGADLSAVQYRFVKHDSTQNQIVVATAGTDKVLGVLQDSPRSGDVGRVTLLNGSGTTLITASAAISKDAYVTATTGGKAVATTTAGHVVCGQALEAAGADGDVIEILLTNFHHKA
jgi:hypothetical protein